jgi:hypothetical protein
MLSLVEKDRRLTDSDASYCLDNDTAPIAHGPVNAFVNVLPGV